MRALLKSTKRDSRRRFNMADWLIITAATAATLAVLRDAPDWSHHVFLGGYFHGYLNPPLALRIALRATYVLIPWTVAVFLMGLRHPRPELRDLITRPGMAACGAVTIWLGFKTLLLVLMASAAHRRGSWSRGTWGMGWCWCPGPLLRWRGPGSFWPSPGVGVPSPAGSTAAGGRWERRGLPWIC